MALVMWLLLGALLVTGGCSESEKPFEVSSQVTTNHFNILVEGPPFQAGPDGVIHGVILPNSSVRVEFRDVQHEDPDDHGDLLQASRSGVTGAQGTWQCTVTYAGIGSYAADVVLIWVSHGLAGSTYTSRTLDENGEAFALVQLDGG